MIDGVSLYLGLHPRRHIPLRLWHDHSVVLGNEKPARDVLPKRAPYWDSDAAERYRPLHGGQDGSIVRRCVLREGHREGFFGQPNQTLAIGRELRGLGMWLQPIEHVCYRFALVRSKTGDVNQRRDPIGPRQGYDRTA